MPHGEPVRLRETVEDVKVWVKDADGQPMPGRMDLPEGCYCLPVPDNDEPAGRSSSCSPTSASSCAAARLDRPRRAA